MNNILFKNIYFSYTNDFVFQNESFSIPKGSLVGIIGPNGGGKTTLLKLLLGFLHPQKGLIQIFDKTVEQMQEKMGYVPQHQNFDKDFPISVFELVLMGALSKTNFFYRYSTKEKEKAKKIIEILGLKDHQKSAFGHLSGGLAQRALIARALISNPEILFLDEPTANVDTKTKQVILDVLQEMKGKTTIFMVSHDLSSTLNMFDIVLCVEKNIKPMLPNQVCEHFKIGLYHGKL